MQVEQIQQASLINKPTHQVGLFYVFIPNYESITRSDQKSKKERYAFPSLGSINSDPANSFCSAERLLKIYNKHLGRNQKKLTKAVKEWFKSAAHQSGWHTVRFLEDVQTGQTSGCMLAVSSHKGN